ncbi:MAG: hypothetical protein LBN99_05980 [Oscillospiraceae bacterium]|jgi:hypothetical protein|nr:hypothetical protein [Oscillospiraceae bacterium]
MANFDDIKQKAREVAGVIADVSVDLYKKAEEKSKIFAKIAKLQAENASDRSSVRKLYLEIGKTYFETHKLFPEPELEQDCAEVAAALERIEERKAEIAAIKAAGDAENDAEYTEAPEEPAPEAPQPEETDSAE